MTAKTIRVAIGAAVVLLAMLYFLNRSDNPPSGNPQPTIRIHDSTSTPFVEPVDGPTNDAQLSPEVEVSDDSVSNRTANLAVNDAFRFLDDTEMDSIAPAIDQKFFTGESDGSYRSHSVLEVDTEVFKSQLQKAWLETETSKSDVFVAIPVTEEANAEILIRSWIDHASGVIAGYGDTVISGQRTKESAQVYFSPDGRMRLSLSGPDASYNFTFVRDHATYVVMATTPNQRID